MIRSIIIMMFCFVLYYLLPQLFYILLMKPAGKGTDEVEDLNRNSIDPSVFV